MDPEVEKKAEEEGLDQAEAEKLQDFVDGTGLSPDDAIQFL